MNSLNLSFCRQNGTVNVNEDDDTICQTIAASGEVEIRLQNACDSYWTINSCPLLYISVQSSGASTSNAICTGKNHFDTCIYLPMLSVTSVHFIIVTQTRGPWQQSNQPSVLFIQFKKFASKVHQMPPVGNVSYASVEAVQVRERERDVPRRSDNMYVSFPLYFLANYQIFFFYRSTLQIPLQHQILDSN